MASTIPSKDEKTRKQNKALNIKVNTMKGRIFKARKNKKKLHGRRGLNYVQYRHYQEENKQTSERQEPIDFSQQAGTYTKIGGVLILGPRS